MTLEMKTAQDRYQSLLEAFILEVERIDNITPWREVEPNWWLHMMEQERAARNYLTKLKSLDNRRSTSDGA